MWTPAKSNLIGQRGKRFPEVLEISIHSGLCLQVSVYFCQVMRGMCKDLGTGPSLRLVTLLTVLLRSSVKEVRKNITWGVGQEGGIRQQHPGEQEHVKASPALLL